MPNGETICLLCSRAFTRLTNTHLRAHGLTPREYRARFFPEADPPRSRLVERRESAREAIREGFAPYVRAFLEERRATT